MKVAGDTKWVEGAESIGVATNRDMNLLAKMARSTSSEGTRAIGPAFARILFHLQDTNKGIL